MKNILVICRAAALMLSFLPFLQAHSNEPVSNGALHVQDSWNMALQHILSSFDPDDGSLDELQVLLEDIHDAPMNINSATPDMLARLPFLSYTQIEEISAYIYFHGAMLSTGELSLVRELDYETVRLLRHFVYAGPVDRETERLSLSKALAYGRHEVVAGMEIPLYLSSGFKAHGYSELVRYPNRQYMGGPLTHSLRWSLNWNDRVRVGVTLQQDAGEPFMGHANTSNILTDYGNSARTYDFVSPYVFVRDAGPFKTLVLGRFKAVAGCGLLLGSSFQTGVSQASAKGMKSGFSPWSSTRESGYFTGVGMETGGRYHTFSVLLSSVRADAVLDSEGSIQSLKTDGYHRTQLELERRLNCRLSTAGTGVRYSRQGQEFGVSAVADLFSTGYMGGSPLLAGMSAHYRLLRPDYALQCELSQSVHATGTQAAGGSADNGMACQALVQLHLGRRRELLFMGRYYGPRYMALHSSAWSQTGVGNEYGLTARWEKQTGSLKTTLLADAFAHPEPVSGASATWHGIQLRSDWQLSSYRFGNIITNVNIRSVQKDCKATGNLEYKTTLRSKFKYTARIGELWSCQGVLQLTACRFKGKAVDWGRALSLSLSRDGAAVNDSLKRVGLDLDFAACGFNTDSFDSSVSYYEPSQRYQYGFMTLSGRGFRFSALAGLSMPHGLKAGIKAGGTVYMDRTQIGDGARTIASSHKQDIALQVLWKFRAGTRRRD